MRSLLAVRVLVALVVLGSPGFAALEPGLVLYRGTSTRENTGEVHLFVRGAEPNAPVTMILRTGMSPTDPSTALPAGVADARGCLHVPIKLDEFQGLDPDVLLTVQAHSVRDGNRVESNPVFLTEIQSLYLLVQPNEPNPRRSVIWRFDGVSNFPMRWEQGSTNRQLPTMTPGPDGAAFSARQDSLFRFDPGTVRPEVVTELNEERFLDLAVTPDGSMMLALTSQQLDDGHSLLRLRAMDATALEFGPALQLHRTNSRVIRAEIVAADDSRRAFVADTSDGGPGKILECFLGDQLRTGAWMNPSIELSGERLHAVESAGPFLVATLRSLDDPSGRLVVFDLQARERLPEARLSARPLDLQVIRHATGYRVLVLTEGGILHVYELDSGADATLDLEPVRVRLPAARQIAAADGFRWAYALSGAATARILRVDLDNVGRAEVLPVEISSRAHRIGVLRSGSAHRLFVVDPMDAVGLEDSLLEWDLESTSGEPYTEKPARRTELNGLVHRVRIH